MLLVCPSSDDKRGIVLLMHAVIDTADVLLLCALKRECQGRCSFLHNKNQEPDAAMVHAKIFYIYKQAVYL